MSFISITLNHLKAVKAWADAADAETCLDLRSFELEVKARNRYYRLKPRFVAQGEQGLFYTDKLVDGATGFIGWLPYGMLRADLSGDKLAFKSLAAGAGLRVPASWAHDAPQGAFLLKRSAGSFGQQLAGPYRHQARPARMPPESAAGNKGSLFAEQFVQGTSLKVWYWGIQPFFAHAQEHPRLRGDGHASVAALLAGRVAAVGEDLESSRDRPFIEASLAYQGVAPHDVPAAGEGPWFDFRYGRTYQPAQPARASDSVLEAMPAALRQQLDRMGAVAGVELEKRFGAPVLCAVDGVCDAQGQVWWLELNSNPVLPPDGYAHMFASLFGRTDRP